MERGKKKKKGKKKRAGRPIRHLIGRRETLRHARHKFMTSEGEGKGQVLLSIDSTVGALRK